MSRIILLISGTLGKIKSAKDELELIKETQEEYSKFANEAQNQCNEKEKQLLQIQEDLKKKKIFLEMKWYE